MDSEIEHPQTMQTIQIESWFIGRFAEGDQGEEYFDFEVEVIELVYQK